MKNTEYLSNGMGGIVLSAKEAQDVLRTSPAYEEYLSLTEDFRREILDIVRGAKGLKITYDPFFKHVFDPVLHGERLSRLLTVIIGQQVTVKQVLPSQSKRLTAEASLIIMDIVVELESGALANVEIQKVGYRFPEKEKVFVPRSSKGLYDRAGGEQFGGISQDSEPVHPSLQPEV